MRITISGPPGSGTTTLAYRLAEKHNLKLVSAGEAFRQLAREKGMDLAEFSRLAESDLAIDALIDARQKEIAEQQDDIIVEGRLSGWMVEHADLKIWLTAPLSTRSKRIAERDGGDEYAARSKTETREESERSRYRNYYKINIDDLSPYQIVLDSSLWNKDELTEIVDLAVTYLKK
ncbi:MAG TPA: AAA family ATPase [Methanomicrobiales archaeon]|nr:AAA family ATPase [Methanomicrobiales archaeon]